MSSIAEIAKRWPRSAWDYRGLARWISFDESYWTAVLAIGLLFSTIHFDILLWAPGAGPLPLIGELGGSPAGRILLMVLLLINGWILDRHLTAWVPSGRREVPWIRAIRAILATIPFLGLAVIPLWQRLTRNAPSWAFARRSEAALDLSENLPAGFGPAGLRSQLDARLKSWSQRPVLQIAWLIGCQITPWFSGLSLLARDRSRAAVIVCILLHVAGAGAALAHASLRSSLLQMTPGRSLAFRLLPLALLLPFPASILLLLLWFPASEDRKEDRGVVETLYRTRAARRHPLAATRRPRREEVFGDTERHRRQAEAGKIFLLFLESGAICRLAAACGFFLLPFWATPADLLLLLLALPALPGLVLHFAGAAGRIFVRFPHLTSLANHPSSASLALVPPVLLFGVLCGALDASQEAGVLGPLLLLFGLAGANMVLLTTLWSAMMSLSFGKPERPYAARIFTLVLFLILGGLSSLLARPPVFQWLVTLSILASPLLGIEIARRWLAPLRLADLRDRRLPDHLRKLLALMAFTAVLPLGGLALPWWGEMRRRHGSEIDRWAARLREEAA